jgi:VIT1/CCC1 family predicted Fe2+/Mn2+ transporter
MDDARASIEAYIAAEKRQRERKWAEFWRGVVGLALVALVLVLIYLIADASKTAAAVAFVGFMIAFTGGQTGGLPGALLMVGGLVMLGGGLVFGLAVYVMRFF